MTDKLKVGILDLLTILLPGAYVLIMISFHPPLQAWYGIRNPLFKHELINAVLLIGTAYIAGHFIYFISSFLDDLIYEKIRRVYWHKQNRLTAYILKLKFQKTGIDDPVVINAFKWSCAWLISKEPALYAEVERHMAESKLFRSLTVIILLTMVALLQEGELKVNIFLLLAALLLLSLLRYLTQRQKSIQVAYYGMIVSTTETFPKDPDKHILEQLNKRNIYPFMKWYVKINEAGYQSWWSGLLYGLLKFVYAIALCIIPFFGLSINDKHRKHHDPKQ